MTKKAATTTILFLAMFTLRASTPTYPHGSFPGNKKPTGPNGWELVGNFGAYWGNKYQAAFYNGSKSNANNINFILSNYTWNNEIKNRLLETVNRDSFALNETPPEMKYTTTMQVGFGGRYNFNPEWALNVEFNQAKLTAKDFFTLEVFPSFDNASHSYLQYPIWGVETRTNIQVGVVRTLNPTKKLRPLIEIGAVFTNTHVKESKISIEDQSFNLVNIYSGNYVPNSNIQEYEIRQGGIGFGGFLNGGVKIIFTNFVSIELFGSLYYKQINLENYNAFKLNEAAMFRFVLSPGFFVVHAPQQ